MQWRLLANEARVLGSLIEKAISTPEYYPLSINALMNACNQKSNREPFLNLAEDEVRQALHTLGDKGLARVVSSGGRVAKYEHGSAEVFNLGRREEALMCVLLLRGPQTPGELRGRSERLFAFDDVSDVQSTLERLMRRVPALVAMLPRQAGTKEARYVHLLSGGPEAARVSGENAPRRTEVGSEDSMTQHGRDLTAEVEALKFEVETLRGEVGELRERLMEMAARLRGNAAPHARI
jgi:uncharacterized protein